MNVHATPLIEPDTRRAETAIDNLRGVVVLMVIAVHAVLGYAVYAPRPSSFDSPPYSWRTFPVIDAHRFIGFDIFCAWANIFLMPLFFLVSGFFVWKSLERNGALHFAQRRALRLGPPFILGVAVVMPIAIFPAYAERTAHPQLLDYLRHLQSLPVWPDGPMWFLWVLLAFDLVVAGLLAAFPPVRIGLMRLASYAAHEPRRFLAGVFVLSALAYLPLGTVFGPMRWFQWGPFSFQLNFIALYAVYFGTGVVIGASGLERGLLHPYFARQWKKWLLAAVVLFAGWLLVSAKTFMAPTASTGWMLADAIALVPACFASCIWGLLITVQFGRIRTGLLRHLQTNAFGMYWVHYAIVTWLQFALLAVPFPAIAKAPMVFIPATLLSWASAVALRHVPILNRIVGAPQRPRSCATASLASAFPLPD
ncbi:MAG TPA: acyltransferase [Rhizomicrobium sp.]|jgi:peptidoglycan/LPS O-acetylase OafA/YrhL|nr:acyltransferase [Rhizomicrobium sp.]